MPEVACYILKVLKFNHTAHDMLISLLLGFTKICTPIAVSLLRTILTSLLTANSSRVLIGCFILGVVRAEVTIPVYEFTRTMAHKTQAPASTRNEKRLTASLPPFIDSGINFNFGAFKLNR